MLNPQPSEARRTHSTPAGPSVAAISARQIDFVQLAWRYRFLLMLGLGIGLAGGYYHFIQTPEIFFSVAKLQIVEPVTKNFPVQGLESGRTTRSFADEERVKRGESILRKAVELGDLPQTPGFRGWNADSIAGALAGSKALKVTSVGDSNQTSIFQVSYEAGDSVTAQRVVQAIVDAYAAHLQNQYRNIGTETLDLIRSAKNEVLTRLESQEAEFDRFKQASALVIRDGRATSVHRDNADRFLEQKQSLIVRKTQLESTLRAASEAMEAQEPLESVLMALSGPLGSGQFPSLGSATEKLTAEKVRRLDIGVAILPSEQMRESRLLPLEAEVEQLMIQLGAGHPAVKSLQSQISLVKASIARLQTSEEDYVREMAQLMAAEDANLDAPIDPLAEVRRQVTLKLLALRQQLVSVEQEMSVISKAYDFEIEAAKSENTAEMQVEKFTREISRQQALYDKIVARLNEINIISDAGSLRVSPLESAKPGYSIAPKRSETLIMGGLLGVMLAAALAYLSEISDKSYRTAEQVSEHLGIPVIGHIPVIEGETTLAKEWGHGIDPHLVSFYRPKSATSEAFKAIRTALYFSNRSGDFKVVQVTSPTPGDGKSTVAANLAVSMVQSGKSVLLVDSDLRRPRVQKLFGIDQLKGLAWLLDQLPNSPSPEQVKELLAEVIVESPIENLSILGAGHCPDNPSELLSSAKFDFLSTVLSGLFDVVIIDSPPLLAVTDPSTLASRVDGVILVVRLRENVRPLAARASRMLETLEANVIGVVVNGVGSRAAKGYGKYADTDGYHNRGRNYQFGYGYTYGSYSYGSYDEYYTDDQSAREKKAQLKKKPIEESR